MEKRYIIGIDQSTQGTKALLFDGEGHLLRRTDLPHRQIVNEKGWVSHDLNEIYRNTVQTVKTLVTESGVAPETIAGIGISNQRETTAIWDKATGEPLEEAIVWQCGRASGITQAKYLTFRIHHRTAHHLIFHMHAQCIIMVFSGYFGNIFHLTINTS